MAGVTRVANITGLDHVGIPVYSAIRPRATTLAVASGKGLTPSAAMVSAGMEAIEVFSAESAVLPEICRSRNELRRAGVSLPLDRLPLRRHALISADASIRWTLGTDLVTGAQTAVPIDLVTLARPREPTSPFHSTSNGLASGAVHSEAVLAALLEVIERDGVCCWRLMSRTERRPLRRVRPDTLARLPQVARLLEQIRAARVEAVVYDCAVDTQIPVYFVRLFDQQRRSIGVFSGSGAHLDPEVALVRAITEAAQSRAVYLAGSRDDVSSRELALAQAQDNPAVIDRVISQPATVDASAAPSMATDTFETDILRVLERMTEAGIEQVIVVDLTPDSFIGHLDVVRVIVPGLAGPDVDHGLPSGRVNAVAGSVAT